ncbi:alpha/beta fold hydrolase [Vibrio sp. V27_P1S3P104]|uniref:alpha/beta fold hydrolase n=1 Tax=Vibrio TaxID=662 RepID=UPI000C166DE1|nr:MULTISPECIES: alpha/beta fold hydrolase [Vibrio]NAW68941.1 alpha/beta fold hydrolase [Vibrio sp. V28_P6S34P95]NAX03851.1 alpha/beta fold hydrolase [Vibrio sp. V30_P3S12P165]NAX35008.1 alpha/beta fold hydrolase [Vibrio sp. V29_P1S30P107]NAX38881.1 alpha/beta fold hydrolase [Vibrio sp. V27_P1S3P104]NAX39848.1 alpha/beta fold hydrolase [Vibrio sp. V26_P1S5P106]
MLHTYSQESYFPHLMQQHIAPWWEQACHQAHYQTQDNINLYWCSMTSSQHTKAIVVVNGRLESVWKYQELFYDLFHQGYDIYSFDHRGQGLSDRLLDDREIGHVHSFDDYVSDLAALVSHFNLQRYTQRFLLAHSMGGAIATRYLQTYPTHPFNAVTLSAPMFGIHMPWQLRAVAEPLARMLTYRYRTPHYAPGYGPYYAKPFAINPLTHSAIRYQWFRALYEEKPELKLGGPSTRWVWQALKTTRRCRQYTRQLTIPLLLLQAECDTIVSNASQTRFITQLARTNPNARMQRIDGAKHELLFEQDHYRNQALEALLDHFNSPPSK